MSAVDLAALLGTFLAAIITGLGLRKGEAEGRDRPDADQILSSGVMMGADPEPLRGIQDGLGALHADLQEWRRQDDQRLKADTDRETRRRFEQIEADQAKMLHLLRRMEAVAAAGRDDQVQQRG